MSSTEIINELARNIGRQKLESFYADPKNKAEFDAWLAKRNQEKVNG